MPGWRRGCTIPQSGWVCEPIALLFNGGSEAVIGEARAYRKPETVRLDHHDVLAVVGEQP